MTSDTDKHERIDTAALHHEVINWCSNMAVAARLYKSPPEVIRDFDRLLAMARGETP
jgi:hypothetical protein